MKNVNKAFRKKDAMQLVTASPFTWMIWLRQTA